MNFYVNAVILSSRYNLFSLRTFPCKGKPAVFHASLVCNYPYSGSGLMICWSGAGMRWAGGCVRDPVMRLGTASVTCTRAWESITALCLGWGIFLLLLRYGCIDSCKEEGIRTQKQFSIHITWLRVMFAPPPCGSQGQAVISSHA